MLIVQFVQSRLNRLVLYRQEFNPEEMLENYNYLWQLVAKSHLNRLQPVDRAVANSALSHDFKIIQKAFVITVI